MASGILERISQVGAAIGPYLMLEVVMPGGTLLAFLLFLHRRRIAVAQALEGEDTQTMIGATPQPTDLAANP